MTHIGGSGRADKLTNLIVKAIRESFKKGLPSDWVEDIFGELLKDHVIREKLKK